MALFAGVSLVTKGKLCTTSSIDVVTDRGYYLLVVKDYSHTVQEMPNGEGICCGPFMVGGYKWCIDYYPNGEKQSCADYISLNLCLDDDDIEEAVEVKFRLSLVDQVEKQKPKEISAMETRSFSAEDMWGYRKFMRRDALELSAHLKADCFTIRCDIMVCNDLNTGGTLSDIGQHFDNLLQNKLGSDVSFKVGAETFAAHRCVLAARSTVFKAQLFGPMKEGTTASVIQIKDMEAKVFAALLSFIYTDSFPKMEKEEAQAVEGQELETLEIEQEGQEEEASQSVTWLQDLLVAADRYDIQQLKFLCEKQLSENIVVSSVASNLVLAEQHHCHILKEACLKFIKVQSPRCLRKVMATGGWEHIRMTFPSLLKEFVENVASNQKNKKRKQERM